jgi:hypothetical protein
MRERQRLHAPAVELHNGASAPPPVIPAKAGIQRAFAKGGAGGGSHWIPAFAGMTERG